MHILARPHPHWLPAVLLMFATACGAPAAPTQTPPPPRSAASTPTVVAPASPTAPPTLPAAVTATVVVTSPTAAPATATQPPASPTAASTTAAKPAASAATAPPTAASTPGEVRVQMVGIAFQPAMLTVPVGTTIVWVNAEPVVHTIAHQDLTTFSSPVLNQGETFRYTFTRPGEYPYLCTIHPDMVGSITVR